MFRWCSLFLVTTVLHLCIADVVNIEIISIHGNHGDLNRNQFSFDLTASTEAALDGRIEEFCRDQLDNQYDGCTATVRERYMLIHREREEFKNSVPVFLQPDKVASMFSDDLLSLACPHSSDESTNSDTVHETHQTCLNQAQEAIRSVKMMVMGDRMIAMHELVSTSSLVNVAANWKDGIEGHILMYLDKVSILQSMADDRRVETICEVGFNLGHSAANWMAANPRARVLAFDISRQLYTAAAINAFEELYPNRIITLVEGNSQVSVPNFARMFDIKKGQADGFKCNIILIDGAHDFNGAHADIVNFAPFANESFHRVIIDDIGVPSVRQAVESSVANGILSVEGDERRTPFTPCKIAEQRLTGPYKGSYVFRDMTPDENCLIPTTEADDIIWIGEYL